MDAPVPSPSADRDPPRCEISVVLPVFNEQECVAETLRELFSALEALGRSHEVVAVDDGSTDRTPALLREARARHPRLRVLTLTPNSGQSAAFGAGFLHARGAVTVLMDADGQNDPNDIGRLVAELEGCDACCGIRAHRRDSWAKRLGSRIANGVRARVLGDGIVDTGCSLKAIRTEFVRDLPMTLRGMHRFLPALLAMRGARIRQIPVNHRPRAAGKSKYTNWGRLVVTVADMRAVRWMQRRHRRFRVAE
jgi:glycosyltransferase involved in cell wall biosynthesis